jgi:hypothetical protein
LESRAPGSSGGKLAYFLDCENVCLGGKLSIFYANAAIWLNFLHEFWSFGLLPGATGVVWLTGFLNRADDLRVIHLESAAQVLHMNCVT